MFSLFCFVKVHQMSSRENQNQSYKCVQRSVCGFTAGREKLKICSEHADH